MYDFQYTLTLEDKSVLLRLWRDYPTHQGDEILMRDFVAEIEQHVLRDEFLCDNIDMVIIQEHLEHIISSLNEHVHELSCSLISFILRSETV